MSVAEVQTTRGELRARALALRAEGVGYSRIARELRVPKTTVIRWTDPAAAQRLRTSSHAAKRRVSGTCERCGAVTRYHGRGGTRVAALCATCGAAKSGEARRGTGPVQRRTVAFLTEPRRYRELRDHLGLTDGHMSVHLHRLVKQGVVTRLERGLYVATASRAREPEAASPTRRAESSDV